ncbi:2'-5' RNA ligase family protein [Mucilaginibacter glaciei]|uniref:2'-5' RNA ligase family protein n=1 Tax=Mucilaginibacter glaciei TaxID=2772109 RepID=A0A926NM51_9SPHI|nr:2'-5' RNA ligase family protein [Mucilaginibacter glaciei]MBD1392176.1 2'-5' RNA ligase family protein [Mucilaginibacter glaciei]
MDTPNPLLLTLNINAEAQQYFDTLRQKHFPPERNFLDAHLMLFHQLPPNNESVITDIENIIAKHQTISIQVTALVGIGRGVAFKLESTQLAALHRELQTTWKTFLIPQDTQRLWPHITIQNKVTPEEAKVLLEELSQEFKPFEITGTGLSLWEYQGGPWQFLRSYDWKS